MVAQFRPRQGPRPLATAPAPAASRTRPTEEALDRLTLSRQIIDLAQHAEGTGVHLAYQVDFDHFRETIDAIPEKKDLSAMFDVELCDISAETGFWIKGTDDGGRTVHVQSVRFDDLTGTTLARHWEENRILYQPPGLDLDLRRSSFTSAPAAHQITGCVCYHGELWIHADFRGKHLASRLANIAMLMALTRFRPDYIYCLIMPDVVRTGLSLRNGYLHHHPKGIRWQPANSNESIDEYLVWMDGAELAELMERPLSVS